MPSLACSDCDIRYPQDLKRYRACLGCGKPTVYQMLRGEHPDFKERAFEVYYGQHVDKRVRAQKALGELVDEIVVTVQTPIPPDSPAA